MIPTLTTILGDDGLCNRSIHTLSGTSYNCTTFTLCSIGAIPPKVSLARRIYGFVQPWKSSRSNGVQKRMESIRAILHFDNGWTLFCPTQNCQKLSNDIYMAPSQSYRFLSGNIPTGNILRSRIRSALGSLPSV